MALYSPLLNVKQALGISFNKNIVEIPDCGRETLAELFNELNFTLGAEVGVEAGVYAEILCKANPNLKLIGIDAWTPYKGYRDHVTNDKLNRLYQEAKNRLLPNYNAELIKGFSMDVVKQFKDNSLDFVYIDANHEYQHVVNDIAEWQKKVKVGGIVAGHDFVKRKNGRGNYLMHVPMAIEGYMESYELWPLFVLGSKETKQGQMRDKPRSWFYVKPEPRPIKAMITS